MKTVNRQKLTMFFVYIIHYLLVGANRLLDFLKIKGPVTSFLKMIIRACIRFVFRLTNGFVAEGRENIPKNVPAIIACNHQSYLDPPLIGSVCPGALVFISKIENFRVPLLGPLIELAGAVPIERRGGNAISAVEKILKSGGIILFFPEGTIPGEEDVGRSNVERETGLLRGRTGAVRLAISSGAVIVPCGVSGTNNALPPEAVPKKKMRPMLRFRKKIKIRFGKPISYKQYTKDASPEEVRCLTDQLMKEISGLVDFSMSFPPFSVPVSDEDYKNIVEFERQWRPAADNQ